jgi:hypothetical protein
MTALSPAAQAVRDAFDIASIDTAIFGDPDRRLAAALRAAADQICMKQPLGDTDADYGVFAAHNAISTSLFAIAAELEGASDL